MTTSHRSEGSRIDLTDHLPPWLTCHELDSVHRLYSGTLPSDLTPTEPTLRDLWDLHPPELPELTIHGRTVKAPRWQQAYARDYRCAGQVSVALPVPPLLEPFLAWSQRELDGRLNGLLLNWYDTRLGHYIGPHRDKTAGLVKGAPIVTISLGAERVFRLRAMGGALGRPPRFPGDPRRALRDAVRHEPGVDARSSAPREQPRAADFRHRACVRVTRGARTGGRPA